MKTSLLRRPKNLKFNPSQRASTRFLPLCLVCWCASVVSPIQSARAAEAGNPVTALAADPNTQIVARSQDFAVVRSVVPLTDVDGTVIYRQQLHRGSERGHL